MRGDRWILVIGIEVLYSGVRAIQGEIVQTLLLPAEVEVAQKSYFCP
jgi:hypothetical protein